MGGGDKRQQTHCSSEDLGEGTGAGGRHRLGGRLVPSGEAGALPRVRQRPRSASSSKGPWQWRWP